MKISQLMTRDPATGRPDSTWREAATLMRQEDCGSLPVADEGRLVGIVTDRDIVIQGIASGRDAFHATVAEVMSADPFTIAPDADAEEAAQLMAQRQVRRLPVAEDGRLEGIVVLAQVARVEGEQRTGAALKQISEPPSLRGSHARG